MKPFAIRPLLFLLCFFIKFAWINAQTRLDPGDLAIIQVNANNNLCSGVAADRISFICFKDITAGTTIDITDNGWERGMPGKWGNSEGFLRATRSGPTIPAGTVITFEFPPIGNNPYRALLPDANWNFVTQGSINTVNLNSGGDQFYFMQGGTWNQGTSAVGNFSHDATYNGGRILFGFNTKTQWLNNNDPQDSKLHPDVAACFNMAPTGNATDFIAYVGATNSTTQLEWISRIANPNNWRTFAGCAALPIIPTSIPIANSGIGMRCTTCQGCDTINEVLKLSLPPTGGPFILEYSDGLDTFMVNNVQNNDSISIKVGETSTFFIVSVTDAKGCPIYSNFDRPVTVTVTPGVSIQPIVDPVVACMGAGQQATFSLTALEGQIRGNTGLVVQWYRDITLRDTIKNPDQFVSGNATIFAITTDGVCRSQATSIVLQMATAPKLTTTAGDTVCGGICARLPLSLEGKAPFILGYIVNEGGSIVPSGLVTNNNQDTLIFCPTRSGKANILFTSIIDGNGCPALIDIQANVFSQNADTLNIVRSLCQGEQLTVNGTVYDENRPQGIEFLSTSFGCDSIIRVDLNFSPRPNGSISGDTTICGGGAGRLKFQLSGAAVFNLMITNGRDTIPFNNVTNGTVLPVILSTTSTFKLLSVQATTGGCTTNPTNSTATITISEPVATARVSSNFGRFNISCFGAKDGSAKVDMTGGKAPYRYAWNNNANTQSINNLGPGAYQVVVTDSAGCQAIPVSVTLTEPDSLRFQVAVDSAVCPGQVNQLQILNVTGAGGPYAYSLDGAAFSTISGTLTLKDLASGTRNLRLRDGNSCIAERNVRISNSAELSLELGPNQSIFAGDSVIIKPLLNFTPASINWQPGTDFQPFDVASIIARPSVTTTYQLIAKSANGCVLKDILTVVVEKRLRIFAPNVFSPNGDNLNDRFTIYYGSEVAQINSLRIFDRWGAMVFSGENLGADENSGWDGFIKDKQAPIGVYVFMAEAKLKTGKIEIVKGSLTLVR
jgi:gliding motility-associated-like protein